MSNFLLRLIVNAAALAAAAAILPGIDVRDDRISTLLIVALIFGIVNAVLKPIFLIMSCPLIILTLGLFWVVINGIMLEITDRLAGDRFQVDGLLWAILGGLVVGIIAAILESMLGLDEKDKAKKKRDNDVIIMPR